MCREVSYFQCSSAIISRRIESAALSFSAGMNGSLSIMVTGNNSGALLLTMLDFTIRRGDERFTRRPCRKRRPERHSASQIGDAGKDPAFNRARASPLASQPIPVSRTPR